MLIGGIEVVAGNVVSLTYDDGVERQGIVDRTGTSKDRHSAQAEFIGVRLNNGQYRHYTVSKIQGIKVV